MSVMHFDRPLKLTSAFYLLSYILGKFFCRILGEKITTTLCIYQFQASTSPLPPPPPHLVLANPQAFELLKIGSFTTLCTITVLCVFVIHSMFDTQLWNKMEEEDVMNTRLAIKESLKKLDEYTTYLRYKRLRIYESHIYIIALMYRPEKFLDQIVIFKFVFWF